MKKILSVTAIAALATSCVIINPGEVGVKQTLGKIHGETKTGGTLAINPLVTQVIKVRTTTINREVSLNLPSKEGLNVEAEISILYHIKQDMVIPTIKQVGLDFERILILSTFRSTAADVCANHYAKDMHSGKRSEIESEIKEKMTELLSERGIVIEGILLKSITLPARLYAAIEEKLRAEQESQQMEFILTRERQEAERKKIEAEGIKTAQQILQEGITTENIQWKSLEVFQELSKSPNAKIIITNGETPMILNANETK